MNTMQKIIKIVAIVIACVIIVNIIGGILWIISLFTDISFNYKNNISFTNTYSNIESIKINVETSNIEIRLGDEFKVEAKNVSKKFVVKDKKGVLQIEENNKWFFKRSSSGKVTIYIPYDIKLDKIEIDNGAGSVTINGISSYRLEVNQGVGELKISNSNFDHAKIEGGVGNSYITLTSFGSLDLDTGVGKVDIMAQVTNDSQIECGIGELVLTLIGSVDDYKIIAEKGIGSIKIDGTEWKNKVTYGNGSTLLEINGGIGSINIKFDNIVQ